MSRSLTVLEQVRLVEHAVAEGEYELANQAAQRLQPLLGGAGIEEMFELRERMKSLKLGVVSRQAEDAAELKRLQQKRGGAAAYQRMYQSMNF